MIKDTNVKYNQVNAIDFISKALQPIHNTIPIKDVLILCIGTDRSTGDSLGPLVGSNLQKANPEFRVMGTLDNPIHAANLADNLRLIAEDDDPPKLVIAIDASLGDIDNVGLIRLYSKSIQPGAGVGKRLPEVGDIAITGVVNVGGFMEYFVLQNTRLSLVMKMANTISEGILQAFEQKLEQVI